MSRVAGRSSTAAAKRGWNWEGGTAITVQQGDTIDGLVKRYGVPASAIAEANNIPNGTALRPGQRLVIPKYEATGSTHAAHGVAAPHTPRRDRSTSDRSQHVHVVAPGETLMALSRKYHKPLADRQGQQHRAAYDGEGRRPHRHSGRACDAQAAVEACGDGGRAAEARRRAEGRAESPAAAPAATPSAAMVTPAAHEPEPPKAKADVTAGAAEIPLAGERPRHHRLRAEAERPAERRHQRLGAGRHADQGGRGRRRRLRRQRAQGLRQSRAGAPFQRLSSPPMPMPARSW